MISTFMKTFFLVLTCAIISHDFEESLEIFKRKINKVLEFRLQQCFLVIVRNVLFVCKYCTLILAYLMKEFGQIT